MKKIIKGFLSLVIITALMISLFAFNVSAASVTVNGGEYNVGSSVKITINFNADATLYAVEADVSYNSSVLRLDSVSGADYNIGNGTVKIVDDKFTASNPAKSSSYTLNFTAIAAGNSNISVSVLGAGESTSKASASAAVKVVTPKPSSNANLSGISLSAGALSPAFSANTTSYNVTVKYSVDSISISGAVADGGARYVGGGTFGLDVGNNSQVLTVTAADGTKKSYTINIKRMTEEETAAAEAAEREANPTLVVINDVDYNIVNDITLITVPAGFTAATEIRKETELPVLKDDAGKYTLWYLTDANGENGDYYTRDENDNFVRLGYVNANGKMYIVEPSPADMLLPTGFIANTLDLNGVSVPAFKSENAELGDFYVLYMYVGGENGYYRYDSLEGTIQRAHDFYLGTIATEEEPVSIFATFAAMPTQGKVVIAVLGLAVLAVIALIVLLIVKISRNRAQYDDEDMYTIPLQTEITGISGINFTEEAEPTEISDTEPTEETNSSTEQEVSTIDLTEQTETTEENE